MSQVNRREKKIKNGMKRTKKINVAFDNNISIIFLDKAFVEKRKQHYSEGKKLKEMLKYMN